MGAEENLGGVRNRIVGYGLEDPEQLLAHPNNWRGHPTAQREALGDAMAEIGWVAPILVNTTTGHVIDGHLRVDLALQKGLTKVPVIYLQLTPEEEAEALATLDPLSAMAFTNQDTLNRLMADFSSQSSAINSMLTALRQEGCAQQPAADTSTDDGDTDDDDDTTVLDECVAKWKPSRGMVWSVQSNTVPGYHYVMCGDSTNPDDVQKLFSGGEIGCIMTSPPYDQQRTYRGNMADDWVALMRGVVAAYTPHLSDRAQVFVNLGLVRRSGRLIRYWDQLFDIMDEHGIPLADWYVWSKTMALPLYLDGGSLNPSHEWIFHFRKALVKPVDSVPTTTAGEMKTCGSTRLKNGSTRTMCSVGKPVEAMRTQQSVIEVPAQNGDRVTRDHPARYPVGVPLAVMKAWPGVMWADPFLGSGTSIVAAERAECVCRGMELDPGYTAIALEKLSREGLTVQVRD